MELIKESVTIWPEEFREVNDNRVFVFFFFKYRIGQVTIKFSKDKARARKEKLKIRKTQEFATMSEAPVEKLEILKTSMTFFISIS